MLPCLCVGSACRGGGPVLGGGSGHRVRAQWRTLVPLQRAAILLGVGGWVGEGGGLCVPPPPPHSPCILPPSLHPAHLCRLHGKAPLHTPQPTPTGEQQFCHWGAHAAGNPQPAAPWHRYAGQPVLSSSRPGIKSHPVISARGITQGLSRNVPRPLCGSVGPCSTRSYLLWQRLVASLVGSGKGHNFPNAKHFEYT